MLQYSYLGNPMDSWRAIVHGIVRVRCDLVTKPPPPPDIRETSADKRVRLFYISKSLLVFLQWSVAISFQWRSQHHRRWARRDDQEEQVRSFCQSDSPISLLVPWPTSSALKPWEVLSQVAGCAPLRHVTLWSEQHRAPGGAQLSSKNAPHRTAFLSPSVVIITSLPLKVGTYSYNHWFLNKNKDIILCLTIQDVFNRFPELNMHKCMNTVVW